MANHWVVARLHLLLGCPLTLDPLTPQALMAFSTSPANPTALHLVCQGDSNTTQLQLTCYIMMTSSQSLKHALAYMHAHTAAYTQSNLALQRHRDRGSCYLSWVGVCWKNVFLIFSFPSASADRTSLCAAFYWSQRQQAERFVKFSSFPLSFIPPFPSLS